MDINAFTIGSTCFFAIMYRNPSTGGPLIDLSDLIIDWAIYKLNNSPDTMEMDSGQYVDPPEITGTGIMYFSHTFSQPGSYVLTFHVSYPGGSVWPEDIFQTRSVHIIDNRLPFEI